ncbi:MAG: hypothetical protein IIB41_03500 [Candidatus Marinimicrobia bacterium]|nr:hypothetical protein [Candidatus Neomarinimicrobiota bacterium]
MSQFELVIEGHEDFVKGFVRGIVAGSKSNARVLFNNEHDISRTTFKEKIKEFFDTPRTHTHLIVDETTTSLIEELLGSEGEKLNLKIISKLSVVSATFKFEYKAYAENYGTMLKGIFENLPEGVSVSDDYAPKEEIHPESIGAEAYAPEHDYIIRAKGSVTGNLDALLELYTKCRKEPLVNIENIELELE